MVSLRKATVTDIPLIHELGKRAFPATYKELLSPEQIDYMLNWMYSPESLLKQITEERHVYFILYEEEKPLGYLSVQPEETPGVYHLQKLYLLPEAQGKHHGSFLFRHAVNYIRDTWKDAKKMRLNVNRDNTKAIDFYKRMGMYEIFNGDFDIGNGFYMTDYILELDLEGKDFS